jgi:hypothetical protein
MPSVSALRALSAYSSAAFYGPSKLVSFWWSSLFFFIFVFFLIFPHIATINITLIALVMFPLFFIVLIYILDFADMLLPKLDSNALNTFRFSPCHCPH